MTPRALQIIQDEHQALAAMLQSAQMLMAQARRHGRRPDFDVLRAMLLYVDEFPEKRHHRKESEWLFPRVLAREPALTPVIDRLDADHERGEAAIRSLEHALLAFEVMGEPRRAAFEDALQAYLRFYLEHMAIEEREVLPVARRVLTDEDWAELDRAFAANRDPLAGHGDPAQAGDGGDDYRELFARITRAVPAPIGLGPASPG